MEQKKKQRKVKDNKKEDKVSIYCCSSYFVFKIPSQEISSSQGFGDHRVDKKIKEKKGDIKEKKEERKRGKEKEAMKERIRT